VVVIGVPKFRALNVRIVLLLANAVKFTSGADTGIIMSLLSSSLHEIAVKDNSASPIMDANPNFCCLFFIVCLFSSIIIYEENFVMVLKFLKKIKKTKLERLQKQKKWSILQE
jgi:Golgi nucleoside diphosphatase